jgi:hypothetical protein
MSLVHGRASAKARARAQGLCSECVRVRLRLAPPLGGKCAQLLKRPACVQVAESPARRESERHLQGGRKNSIMLDMFVTVHSMLYMSRRRAGCKPEHHLYGAEGPLTEHA